MSSCKACGTPIRKGRRALVVGKGTRVRGLVCRLCASGGTLIVVAVKRRKKPKKRAIVGGDLGEMFGIELDASQSIPKADGAP